MTEIEPPEWGSSPLSSFFRDADRNVRVAAANYPDVFEALERVHAAFREAEGIVEKDSGCVRLVPRFLLIRTHSSFLAAIRAGMSGQLTEALVLLRVAIEQSWYALHMASGDDAGRKTDTWLRRNEDEAAMRLCKQEFTVKNVRSTHASIDPFGEIELHGLYETLINFGAHPNQMGVFAGLNAQESETAVSFQVGILHPAELPVMVTLRLSMAVAIGALRIFQHVYPERFSIMSFESQLQRLIQDLNSRFKPYSLRGRGSTA